MTLPEYTPECFDGLHLECKADACGCACHDESIYDPWEDDGWEAADDPAAAFVGVVCYGGGTILRKGPEAGMSDTAAVLAAIERLQEECRSSQAAVMENAPLCFGFALSALEALVKERGTKFRNFVEYQKLAIEADARLADFVAAVGGEK